MLVGTRYDACARAYGQLTNASEAVGDDRTREGAVFVDGLGRSVGYSPVAPAP